MFHGYTIYIVFSMFYTTKKISGLIKDRMRANWRKVHNAELRHLHPSVNIILVINSRGVCGTHGAKRAASRILTVKPEGKRLLGRSRPRLEDNIKMNV
jgi:hypothetical protein